MVRLKSYYSLCPLIDKRSFLGVTEDNVAGCGIVTLSKNVVNRYKFSDQKQIGGWASKDHISAPVVYDTSQNKYVGVFNQNTIKTWESDVKTLDKLKKKKFNKTILKLINDHGGNVLLIFKDGDCAALSYAIDTRRDLKQVDIISKDDVVIDIAVFVIEERSYICYVHKSNEQHKITTCELRVDFNSPLVETLQTLDIVRNELVNGTIAGVTISATCEPPQVHILWSDGRLFSNILRESTFSLIGHVPWISPQVEVSLAWLGGKHLALYGADTAQEGAVLAVYNILFGIGTCNHPLKMFSKGARLWCLKENILLEATQHLGVVPFILSNHRNMLALVGSHRDDTNDDQVLIADWGKGKTGWSSKNKWNNLAVKGLSEREICFQHFPALLENNNVQQIRKSIKDFSDIPENTIITLIVFIIKKIHSNTQLAKSCELFLEQLHGTKPELLELLNELLNLPYVQENMIMYLKKMLTLEDTLFLMRYINCLLSNKFDKFECSNDFDLKLIKWNTILIDSHYQQLLLSNDKSTKEILNTMSVTTNGLIEEVESMENVMPLLIYMTIGKDMNKLQVEDSSTYYIEEIKINGF